MSTLVGEWIRRKVPAWMPAFHGAFHRFCVAPSHFTPMVRRQSMSRNLPQVGYVPVDQIVIDERFLQPTAWDARTVDDDLYHFVSESRLIACTPELSLDHDRLIAINGTPFIRAAQFATPPFSSILCATHDSRLRDDPRIKVVNVTDLIELEEQRHDVLHVLYFQDVLLTNQIQYASTAIEDCLAAWSTPERRIAEHQIIKQRSVVKWVAPASIPEDRRLRKMAIAVQRIGQKLPVTSWNGVLV
jgi:hypothetical protein